MKKRSAHKPLIYLITKGDATAENFRAQSSEILQIIENAVRAKIDLIQIREKQLPAGLIYRLAAEASNITRNSDTKLLVNDRADIALASGSDGVHLTAQSLSAEAIRRSFGADPIIGVSAHSLLEIEKAKRGGADFATFSPIFATASKAKYGAPQGIAKLREAVEAAAGFPLIALGGIDATNFREVLDAGAGGFAAIRFLNDAENLQKLREELRK